MSGSFLETKKLENNPVLQATVDLFHYIPPTAKRGDIVKRYSIKYMYCTFQ